MQQLKSSSLKRNIRYSKVNWPPRIRPSFDTHKMDMNVESRTTGMQFKKHMPLKLTAKKKLCLLPHKNAAPLLQVPLLYSRIPISRIPGFSKLPIIRTKTDFPSPVKHCNFTPHFSNLSIIGTNFLFLRRFEKSGFHCMSKLQCG